ncbi:Lsr2 family DNA-binding protein [Nocardioides glacieisoli]
MSDRRKDLATVREWARAQGLQVSDRGRVSSSVIDQYDAAN